MSAKIRKQIDFPTMFVGIRVDIYFCKDFRPLPKRLESMKKDSIASSHNIVHTFKNNSRKSDFFYFRKLVS